MTKTKKNFKFVEKIKSAFAPRTDFASLDFSEGKPKDIDPEKWAILSKVLKNADKKCKWIAQMIRDNEVELIGILERTTYHKMHVDEDVPYTHIFDNPAILLKHKKSSTLFIYGEHIVYENKFIDG